MAGKLKVLCFHPALAPYRVDFFNLLSERVDLKVVFFRKNLLAQKFDTEELLKMVKFDYSFLESGFCLCQRDVKLGIARIVSCVKPDVVLSYEASPTTLELCVLRFFSKWRLWTFMDDSPERVELRHGLRRVVRDWTIRHCDGIVVPSDLAACAYSAQGRFSIVPIINDEVRFRQDAAQVFDDAARWRTEQLGDGEVALFFVGRLSPEKNLKWLIGGFGSWDLPPNVCLYIVGSGAQEQELQSVIGNCPALSKRVKLLGRRDGHALHVFFAAADLLVLPSVSEPFGAVVAEALQWGAKCLVSEKVGARSLINKNNGCVFALDDGKDFTEKLKEQMMGLPHWKMGRSSLLSEQLNERLDQLVGAFHE